MCNDALIEDGSSLGISNPILLRRFARQPFGAEACGDQPKNQHAGSLAARVPRGSWGRDQRLPGSSQPISVNCGFDTSIDASFVGATLAADSLNIVMADTPHCSATNWYT